MRTGEVLALTWDDIDFESRKIIVNKTVYSKIKDDKGRWFLGSTKTEESCREVYINSTLLRALKNYKNKQKCYQKEYGKDYCYYHLESVENKYGKALEYRIIETKRKSKKFKKVELVFTKNNGRYVGTDLIRYPYKIIHHELGIKKCRFYDLRGSFATKTLRNGVEIKDVANVLGHSKIETTENYYISSSEESIKIASEKFEQTVQSKIIDEIIKYDTITKKTDKL